MARRKKKNDPLRELGKVGVGLGTAGVSLGVSGAVIGRAAAVSPHVAPLSAGIGSVAAYAPIVGTTMSSGIVLGELKKLNKKKRRK